MCVHTTRWLAFGVAVFLLAARARAQTGELTFTFGIADDPCVSSPETWTEADIAALQTQLDAYYPAAKNLYGNPFTTITVKICRYVSASDPLRASGYWHPGPNEIRLPGVKSLRAVLAHEMLHAFHDDWVVRFAVFEEGLADEGRVEVATQVCAPDLCYDPGSLFEFENAFHESVTSAYYEGQNLPAFAAGAQAAFMGGPLYRVQYRLAGYVWGKVAIEHPGFLRAFNARYFAEMSVDPSIARDRTRLLAVARDLAPVVEGLDFDTWIARQHVFDLARPSGYLLVQARDVTEPPLREGSVAVFHLELDGRGRAGEQVQWQILDNEDALLEQGSAITDVDGRVLVALPAAEYRGSVKVVAWSALASSARFWPVAGSAAPPGGIFGVVPHASQGAVTIEPIGVTGPTAVASVQDGYFEAPALGPVAGQFLLTYRTPTGGTASHLFDKDAGRYFVLLTLPDLAVASFAAPAEVEAGSGPAAVAVGVLNGGDAPAPAWRGRIYLSDDSVPDAGDRIVGSLAGVGGGAGSSESVAATVTVPGDVPPGDWWLLACANDPEDFAEAHRDNDCATSPLHVTTAPGSDCTTILPPPTVAYVGVETVSLDGMPYDRYRLEVTNRAAYPAELFSPASDLPPCGQNPDASRTWVEIREAGTDAWIYGFCALGSPEDLAGLWFAVPAGSARPARVAVKLRDRRCARTWTSDPLLVDTPPVPDAGPDQLVVILGTPVRLDGARSYDIEGDPFTFSWALVAQPPGSAAALDDAASPHPAFIADVQGDYVLRLVVSDPWMASAPDEVVVSFQNLAPVATAGANQSVVAGDTVFLLGSATDANGDDLLFQWTLVSAPAGSTAAIADPASALTSFVADLPGRYVVRLAASDGRVWSETSTAEVVAVSRNDGAVQALTLAIATVNTLDPAVFRNANLANALTSKIAAAIALAEDGRTEEAAEKLSHDVLQKTNGCADGGGPDRNDWILDCAAQEVVRSFLERAIALLAPLG